VGGMPSIGLEMTPDIPPIRKSSVQHSEAMIRAPSAYHHDASEPNMFSGKSQEKQVSWKGTTTIGISGDVDKLPTGILLEFIMSLKMYG
jgi:hypothetical protein